MLSENTLDLLFEHCGSHNEDEFEEDVTRVLFIFRLINRYVTKGDTNYRLLINHVIVFYNVFERFAPIALREYASKHKNENIITYLNSVLKVCGRMEEDAEYDETFVKILEDSFNDH